MVFTARLINCKVLMALVYILMASIVVEEPFNGFVLCKWRNISYQSATELDNNVNGQGSKRNQYEALLFTAGGFPQFTIAWKGKVDKKNAEGTIRKCSKGFHRSKQDTKSLN